MKFGKMHYGVVESRMDPLFLGRCKVRVVGVHTDNKIALPTDDLPWAFPLQPITSAAVSGVGTTPLGAVEGTWVVVIFNDDAMQQPFMIGTIAGIPMPSDAKADEIQDFIFNGAAPQSQGTQGAVTTSDGTTLTDGSGNPVVSGSAPTSSTDDDLSKIPTTPPPGSGATSKASAGISAIINACRAGGITNRNAVAAILGIVGGESTWVPKSEGYTYSAERLKTIFKSCTADDIQKYADAKRTGLTKEEFFGFFYGGDELAYGGGSKGKGMGNLSRADGSSYYGRGFIQLTGKSNYSRYAELSGIDIISSPNILNDNLESSAKVAVAYFNDRCKANTKSSSYFDAAIKAIGHNSPDVAAKKRSYYEYFLGGEQPVNDTTPSPPAPDKAKAAAASDVKPTAPSTSSDPAPVGFNDPSGKYPKTDWMKEPDTNRLARKQKLQQTVVQKKKDGRTTGIAIANSGIVWDQMPIPYNASYPFNHVYESESGHVIEIDDTAGAERLHTYHKSGTFNEIDAEGSKSEKIVGSTTLIVSDDSFVCIQGSKHVRIGADNTIVIGGQLQIEVNGNCNIVVKGNVYQTVSGEFNINAGGNVNIQSGGSINLKAGGNINGDGSQVHFNDGSSSAANKGAAYSPGIVLPNPVTAEETKYIEVLEDNTERRKQVFKDDNPEPAVVEKSDVKEPPKADEPISTSCDFPSEITYETILTENFKVGDLCFESGRPFPFGKGQNNLTDREIVCNMKQLCVNILDPLKKKYGDIGFKLNSGFRNGTGKSQHNLGQAADISFTSIRGIGSYADQIEKFYNKAIEIRDSGLPFNQLIFECDPGKGYVWIHISYDKGNTTSRGNLRVCTFAQLRGAVGVSTASPSGYVPGIHKIVAGEIQA
jgi:predicted chitinase